MKHTTARNKKNLNPRACPNRFEVKIMASNKLDCACVTLFVSAQWKKNESGGKLFARVKLWIATNSSRKLYKLKTTLLINQENNIWKKQDQHLQQASSSSTKSYPTMLELFWIAITVFFMAWRTFCPTNQSLQRTNRRTNPTSFVSCRRDSEMNRIVRLDPDCLTNCSYASVSIGTSLKNTRISKWVILREQ